jgi:hypothetical protein
MKFIRIWVCIAEPIMIDGVVHPLWLYAGPFVSDL